MSSISSEKSEISVSGRVTGRMLLINDSLTDSRPDYKLVIGLRCSNPESKLEYDFGVERDSDSAGYVGLFVNYISEKS